MIEQSGQLTRTAGDKAWVRLGGQAGCPACEAGEGCGAGLFGRLLRRRPVELELDNDIQARVGQVVTVGLPERAFLELAWYAYGWPLLGGLAGGVISHQILNAWALGGVAVDVLTLAGGIAMAMFAWRLFTRSAIERLVDMPVQLLATVAGQRACAGRPTPET